MSFKTAGLFSLSSHLGVQCGSSERKVPAQNDSVKKPMNNRSKIGCFMGPKLNSLSPQRFLLIITQPSGDPFKTITKRVSSLARFSALY
ncbi:hypothetical protein NPIL_45451 [Nephila pilipes]|uniref:Uncharacterized protein n=1 Tax=Nephila pilipes TaxID=299642 RepID=A0A8X6P0K7_NEPPI|nr:hypothetical protein NPIL_45451 [Nephila pilipes]